MIDSYGLEEQCGTTALVRLARLRSRSGKLIFAVALAGVAGSLPVDAATYTTFDPPGAVGTAPESINNGVITGNYYDGSEYHGFMRAADGTITTFDPNGSIDT